MLFFFLVKKDAEDGANIIRRFCAGLIGLGWFCHENGERVGVFEGDILPNVGLGTALFFLPRIIRTIKILTKGREQISNALIFFFTLICY